MLLTSLLYSSNKYCCGIDVWGIALNITLQDAPFLAFRLLLITHFNIISYMNIFFTCKNTLVIILQLYRLHVVYGESKKGKKKKGGADFELTNISIISKSRDVCGSHPSPERRERCSGLKVQSRREERRERRTGSEEFEYRDEECGDKNKG